MVDMNRKFQILNKDGSVTVANIVTNFEYMDQKYCIYSIKLEDRVNIYCAKNVDGNLVKVVNPDEVMFLDTVVHKITDVVKEG